MSTGNIVRLQEICQRENVEPPEIVNILNYCNLTINYSHPRGFQHNTIGYFWPIGIRSLKQELLENKGFKNINFIIIGRTKDLYYFYCAMEKVILLLEIPVRNIRYKQSVKNDSILILALQKLILQKEGPEGPLKEGERLLLIDDKVNIGSQQSGYMIMGKNIWVKDNHPLLTWIDKYLNK